MGKRYASLSLSLPFCTMELKQHTRLGGYEDAVT